MNVIVYMYVKTKKKKKTMKNSVADSTLQHFSYGSAHKCDYKRNLMSNDVLYLILANFWCDRRQQQQRICDFISVAYSFFPLSLHQLVNVTFNFFVCLFVFSASI